MSDGLGVFDPDLYENGDPWRGGLPLDLFAELREEQPCYWQSLADEPMFIDGCWVVTRHEDVVRTIRDTARFSNRSGVSIRRFDPTLAERGGRPTMVSMDGADHQRNRTVTSRMFAPRAVNAFADRFRAIAAEVVEQAIDKGRIDFITDLACAMPLNAISDMMGIPVEDRERVLGWTNMITVPLDPHVTPTPEMFTEALHELWEYGLALSNRRKAEPDDGVMTAIAAGHADGRLSDDEVRGYMLQLAAAGNETTRNAIAFGLHALLLRPEQMALARSWQDDFPVSAIDEMLRWASPTIHTVRMALEDVELYGQQVRAGQSVVLMLAAANFDSSKFDRPEQFDIARRPNDHVAFGIGAHTCLGIHVARLELNVLFEELLKRTRSIELDGPVEFVRDSFIHGVRRMPMILSR